MQFFNKIMCLLYWHVWEFELSVVEMDMKTKNIIQYYNGTCKRCGKKKLGTIENFVV